MFKKNKIFTIALTLMGSSFLFAQQWTGANNTTSDISRTGKVSIGTTEKYGNLNISKSLSLVPENENYSSLDFHSFYISHGVRDVSFSITSATVGIPDASGMPIIKPALYIGSVVDKTFVLHNNKIGIGTDFLNYANSNDYRLFVKDGIRTEKVKVDIAANNGWADYVFEPDYKLMPIEEVERFIKQNGHLPEVPTTAEAITNGIELKEMNILLLKKVEELTLYSIQQHKELEELKVQVGNLIKDQK